MILHCETAGVRLDVFLTQALEGMTRSAAQRLLEGNHVKKDGQPVKKNQKTEAGADYTVEIPEAQPIALQPEKIDLDIAYEDSDVVIINKPKGMVVHPAAGHWSGTLVNALLYHCGDSLSGINGQLRPGIVHRIDKDTSGLLLVAKNDFAHQKLAAQLADHTMHRTYVCLVCGNIRDDNGVIDAPIARHPQDRKKMAVCPDGKRAVTHFQVLARYLGYTYVQCRLETGRTHQIRVHMAYIGHPLLGDVVYGDKKNPFRLRGQALHAKKIGFLHPATHKYYEFVKEPPSSFVSLLEKLTNNG